ncbi:MAG TPA: methyltransferase domain-containing protein [Bryobacteraceae bacterium]|nr:methyltransferase domain-containing protein [Bryobacteraceae bacterium]
MEEQPAKGYGPQWKNLWEKTGWWHSFELPDGRVLRGVNTLEILRTRLAQFPIGPDLRGKRVLDIGCWDGWFSFELERRGAEVTALDCWDNPRFHEMHSVYNSRVEFRQMDVMEISPETVGRFDIVLFLGVLYHLKHPLLALEKVCSVTKELAAVDSYVLRDNFDLNAQPVLEFYETDEFEGQTDNWVAPNLSCLVAMCRTAGFARAEFKKVLLYSASVACHRRWEPENSRGPQAELVSAVHNINAGINFDTRRDEYLTIGFKTKERNLTVADVQPSISGFGTRPIMVKNMGGDLWQANFKLPAGLEPGWHEVGVGVRGGPTHGACGIAVDVPLPECAPHIEGVLDGTTWRPDGLDLQYGRGLALWCTGLPENADRHNILVYLNGRRCSVEFIAPPGEKRQINVQVPETIAPGPAEVRLQIGCGFAAPVQIQVR